MGHERESIDSPQLNQMGNKVVADALLGAYPSLFEDRNTELSTDRQITRTN